MQDVAPNAVRIADAIDTICHAYHSSHVSSLVDVILLGYCEWLNIPFRV
jgi:hypothetical protein